MISVDRKLFSRALALAITVVERRSAIPVLATVKMVPNGYLGIQASDLDTFTTVEIPYEGKASETCLCSPHQVRAAINAAGGSTVTLSTPEDSTAVELEAGNLSAKIPAIPADDHPGADRILTEEFSADIGIAELRAIARVMPAISCEETRYYLNGVCLRKVGDWLYQFAATDGHRLMIVDVPLPNAAGSIPDGTIIPKRWLDIVMGQFRNATDGARLTFGPAALRNTEEPGLAHATPGSPRITLTATLADGPRFTLTGKLIDGTYPDYDRVVPGSDRVPAPKAHFTIKRADLLHALNALTPFCPDRWRALSLSFETGRIVCELKSPEVGSGVYPIPATHTIKPGSLTIGFNGRYLMDMLKAFHGEELQIGVTDEGSPALFIDPADTAFRGVLMPIRI